MNNQRRKSSPNPTRKSERKSTDDNISSNNDSRITNDISTPSTPSVPGRRSSSGGGTLLVDSTTPSARRSSASSLSVINSDSIHVVCRFRPFKSNIVNKDSPFQIDGDKRVEVIDESFGGKSFSFDKIFGSDSKQSEIFADVEGVVDSVMSGFNGTVLAYGQTSAGKSWTMEGPSIWDNNSQGIISRSVDKLFDLISKADEDNNFQVSVAYYEIYCEKIRDLLNPSQDNMKMRETKTDGFVVSDLTEIFCTDRTSVLQVVESGKANRVTAPTLMNAESSRSHSIVSILVTQKNETTGRSMRGRLFLVDLAGSEKVGKTGATGLRLEEAKNINSSLTTLGMVINSLCDGSTHIPYRDSKLTKLLMESLGGNSKTTLIICCSPEKDQTPETISTLRFGERAKRIQNHAKVNEDFTMDELKSLLASAKNEIEKLKKIKNLSNDKESSNNEIIDGSEYEVINNLTTSLSISENEKRSLNSRYYLLEEEFETLNSINRAKEELILNLSAEKEALNNTVKELEEKLIKSTIENNKQKELLINVNNNIVNDSEDIDNLSTFEALQEQSDIFKSSLENEMRNLEKTISSKEIETRYAQESATSYADKYLRLREEYDSHIGQLMVKLTLEQQMRTHVEDRLEDALGRIHKSNPSQVSGFFSGLINLVKPDENKAMSTREFNMAKALDQQYAKVSNLQEEISHTKESHQIVLETKESVMRNLVKQNSGLTTEKNILTKRMEEQCVTIEQLTKLLRSVQNSKNSPIRPLVTNTNTIRGGSSAVTPPHTPIFSLTASNSNINSPNTPNNNGAWRSVSPKKDIKYNINQNDINVEDIQLNINTVVDNE